MATSTKLTVTSIQIKDVLGAKQFALEPGRITVLKGANASGKSTALQALQAALSGGNLARLARVDPKGAETEPEVVLVLDGPGSEEYRVERAGDKVKVRQRVGDTAAFEDVKRPQSWLTGLFDPNGSNPVKFLMAPDKDRALLLLEALPLKMPREELRGIISGLESGVLPAIPVGLHPLEELGLIRDGVFRARTGVNRDKDGKAKAADQTRRNAPAVIPEDPKEVIAQGEVTVRTLADDLTRAEEIARAAESQALTAAHTTHEIEEQKVKAAFTEAVRSMRADHDRNAAELRASVEKQIEEQRQAMENAIAGLRESDEAKLDQLDAQEEAANKSAREARAAAESGLAARRQELAKAQHELTMLRAQADQASQARVLHQQAQQFEDEAALLAGESDRLTKMLEALDGFRRRLAEDIPIPGLEIDGKEIRVNAVPFEQMNTQARIDIAVQVATLRAKACRLPVIFVDGAEALDSEHFRLLVQRLEQTGVQSFLCRVEDHPLQVETIGDGRATA